MADMVFRPAFEDVDSEREVVLEEIAMVEDTPHDLVHDLAAEAVFGAHPLGRPVIGRADVIATVSTRALAGYHRRAYAGETRRRSRRPGTCGTSSLVSLLRRAGRRSARGRRPARAEAGATATRARPCGSSGRTPSSTTSASRLRGSTARTSAGSRRRILDAIVGGSASSRLFQEIREKRGMAYSVYSYLSQYADAGQVGLYVGTREENLAACLEIAVAELLDLAQGNVRADELARAKENLKGRLLLSLESTSTRMTRLGKATVTDMPLLEVDEIVRRLEAVTAEDVAALAAELFAPGRLSAAGIGPDESAVPRRRWSASTRRSSSRAA